jgi:hypothetical protein
VSQAILGVLGGAFLALIIIISVLVFSTQSWTEAQRMYIQAQNYLNVKDYLRAKHSVREAIAEIEGAKDLPSFKKLDQDDKQRVVDLEKDIKGLFTTVVGEYPHIYDFSRKDHISLFRSNWKILGTLGESTEKTISIEKGFEYPYRYTRCFEMHMKFTVRNGFTAPFRIWIKSLTKTVYIFIGPDYDRYRAGDRDYPEIVIPVQQKTEAGTWARLSIVSEENGKLICTLKKIVSADGKYEILGTSSISPEFDSDVIIRFGFGQDINYDMSRFSLLPGVMNNGKSE